MNIEVSGDSLDAIKYALRAAKAMDELAHAQAEYAYDKSRMSEIQCRIDALDKALDEIDRR